MHDTAELDENPSTDSHSQLSQLTDPVNQSGEETARIIRESKSRERKNRTPGAVRSVAIALAIAIPLSLLAGVLLTLALLSLTR